jgi:hypothetical protein
LVVTLAAIGASHADSTPKQSREAGANGGPLWDLWMHECCIELYRLHRIAHAPQLTYRLEKLHVFRDSLWVDFEIINPGPKRKYLAADRINVPVYKFRDAAGRKWKVSEFDGCRMLAPPDTFVALDPDEPVRFRALLLRDPKPLVLDDPTKERGVKLPDGFTYEIWGWWGDVYAQLGEGRPESKSAFVRGSGKVPVRWVDENAPKWWRSSTRLYGREE